MAQYNSMETDCHMTTSQEDHRQNHQFPDRTQDCLCVFSDSEPLVSGQFQFVATGIVICSPPETPTNASQGEQSSLNPLLATVSGLNVDTDAPSTGNLQRNTDSGLNQRTDGAGYVCKVTTNETRASKRKSPAEKVFSGNLGFSDAVAEDLSGKVQAIKPGTGILGLERVDDLSGKCPAQNLQSKLPREGLGFGRGDLGNESRIYFSVNLTCKSPPLKPDHGVAECSKSRADKSTGEKSPLIHIDEVLRLSEPEKESRTGKTGGTAKCPSLKVYNEVLGISKVRSEPDSSKGTESVPIGHSGLVQGSNSEVPVMAKCRILPPSIQGASVDMVTDVNVGKKAGDFPTNLLDVVNEWSGEPDTGMGDFDILEIATRSGLTFPRPRWWKSQQC